MNSRFFALFIMALAAGWSFAGHAAIITQDAPGAAFSALQPDAALDDDARGREIQLVQAIPPQCAGLLSSKPEDLKLQLEWFKEVRKCIEDSRDLIAPSLIVDTPEEVDAGEISYTITGYVGDNGSVPTVIINGEVMELTAPGEGAPDLGANSFAFSLVVKVVAEEGDDKFIIEATDANGNSVAEERLVVLVAANQPKFRGDYYALIIGNGEYDFLPPLKTAVSDAKALADILYRYYLFEEKNTQILINATRRDILSALTQLKKSLGKHDRLLVFYSGHGYIDEATGVGFWQAVDADEFDDFSWVSIDSVTRNLAGMQAKHGLVIADSVFPVAVTRGSHSGGKDRFFETIDSYASRKMIISGGLEPMTAPISDKHSIFVHFLLEALGENKEPYITSKQLFDQLSRKIATVTDLRPEWGTVADAGDEGSGEFTFILRSKPKPPAE